MFEERIYSWCVYIKANENIIAFMNLLYTLTCHNSICWHANVNKLIIIKQKMYRFQVMNIRQICWFFTRIEFYSADCRVDSQNAECTIILISYLKLLQFFHNFLEKLLTNKVKRKILIYNLLFLTLFSTLLFFI